MAKKEETPPKPRGMTIQVREGGQYIVDPEQAPSTALVPAETKRQPDKDPDLKPDD